MLCKEKHILNSTPLLGPLQILLFAPLVTSDSFLLEREVEQYELQRALKTWIDRGEVRLVMPLEGNFKTLVQLLHSQVWHLVIFSGHGMVISDQIYLLFSKQSGQVEFITAKDWIDLFKTVVVQCVVLAACHSARSLNGNMSLAMQLAQIGLPHVVGMQNVLLDRAGQRFIQTFCVALAQRENVKTAVQRGCQAMANLLNTNEVWYSPFSSNFQSLVEKQSDLPVLYSRHPTTPLVDWNFCPQPKDSVSLELQLPPIFIGRHQELQQLFEIFQKSDYLLIYGKGGVGKTALAGELIKRFVEQEDYQVICYQMSKKMPSFEQISEKLQNLEWPRCILWLDHVDLTKDQHIIEHISRLNLPPATPVKIVMTSRYPIPQLPHYTSYLLNRPSYSDFQRYIYHLGLPYLPPHINLIYKEIQGNFRGVQLLQSLAPQLEQEDFSKKLAIVQRYLKANSSFF